MWYGSCSGNEDWVWQRAHACRIAISIFTLDRYNFTLSRPIFQQVIHKIYFPASQGIEPVSITETNRTGEGITFMDIIGIHCKGVGKSVDVLREWKTASLVLQCVRHTLDIHWTYIGHWGLNRYIMSYIKTIKMQNKNCWGHIVCSCRHSKSTILVRNIYLFCVHLAISWKITQLCRTYHYCISC
jgi:hypothetical protein